MSRRLALVVAVVLGGVLAPGAAHAQYKNSAFGIDVGYWMLTKPTAIDPSTGAIYANDSLPLRLQNGFRIGGEGNFKIDEDHLWFTGRVNLGLLKFGSGDANSNDLNSRFDYEANRQLGSIIGVEVEFGLRYVFFTDQFRPYLQAGISYMRLMSFSSNASDQCDGAICGAANQTDQASNESVYLRHPNVGAVHLQPGVELIIHPDTALHLYIDAQRWLPLNATGNWGVVAGVGVIFFT
jgi:hypothetical protein